MNPLIAPIATGFGIGVGAIAEIEHDTAAVSGSSGAVVYLPTVAQFRWPNEKLGRALREIESIAMTPNPDPRSDEKLREARAGGMYGFDASL